jgi:apolipoprotein N-acyltransferase
VSPGASGSAAPGIGAAAARDVAAALAGAVLPFAFSPFELWPLALAAPALLYWTCLAGSTARLALRGALFGVASFGIGVSWIHESFQFSSIALPLAIVLTVGFVIFLSAYTALVCAAFALLVPARRRGRPSAAAAFAGVYVLGEWLRGWLLTGFTWLQLGYSQVDGPLAPLLRVVGVYGSGVLMALWACAVVAALRQGVPAAALTGAAGALLALLAAQAVPDGSTRAEGPALRVAILQGNLSQDQKWLPAMRGPTLERYMALTRQHLGADLVVWPETAIPGFRDRVGPFLDELSGEAQSRGSSVLVGLPERERGSGKVFNATELLGRDRGLYRKRHLVPFGEYLPLDAALRPVVDALGIPVSDFSPGPPGQPVLRVAGHPMAVFICYEIAFGAEVAATLPRAEFLVTVSNDAWFGDSIGPLQHLQMARARSIETGRYLVRATNTGVSAVVDPRGRMILELPQFQVAHGETEILPMTGATVYVRVGDLPALLACALCIAWGRLRGRDGGRS